MASKWRCQCLVNLKNQWTYRTSLHLQLSRRWQLNYSHGWCKSQILSNSWFLDQCCRRSRCPYALKRSPWMGQYQTSQARQKSCIRLRWFPRTTFWRAYQAVQYNITKWNRKRRSDRKETWEWAFGTPITFRLNKPKCYFVIERRSKRCFITQFSKSPALRSIQSTWWI